MKRLRRPRPRFLAETMLIALLLAAVAPAGPRAQSPLTPDFQKLRDFLAAINNDSRLLTTIVTPSGEGMSVSYNVR